jgi:hypothetical protein
MADEANLSLLSKVNADLQRKLEAALKSGGTGGTSGGMDDGRITRLEKAFDKIDAKLDGLVRDVAEVKGRVSAMPATWQLLGMIFAIMAATFAFVRFGMPHQ